MLLTKICPSCRAEYRHSVERCSDCDIALIHPSTIATVTLPPANELAALLRCDPWEATRVAQMLHEAGIASRIDTYPPAGAISAGEFAYAGRAGFGVEVCVYVLEADRPVAEELLDRFHASTLPDARDPTLVGEDLPACPGCGTAIAADARACAECGLEFHDPGYE
jgi:hypothetical protein